MAWLVGQAPAVPFQAPLAACRAAGAEGARGAAGWPRATRRRCRAESQVLKERQQAHALSQKWLGSRGCVQGCLQPQGMVLLLSMLLQGTHTCAASPGARGGASVGALSTGQWGGRCACLASNTTQKQLVRGASGGCTVLTLLMAGGQHTTKLVMAQAAMGS